MFRNERLFWLQRLKGIMSGDARDFNSTKTGAVIKFLLLHGKALKEIHAILTEILRNYAPLYATVKIGWPCLNAVIFPPVMRLVLDDPKQ